jgi:hypothetical protein
MSLVLATPREFFVDRVDEALTRLKFSALPQSKIYIVDLLEHYMVAKNLFPVEDESGKRKRETLAEIFLRAHNSTPPVKFDLLKKLGDSSLYISGFFGDSLTRKIVDLDYYVDMGGTAYASLANYASDENASALYGEFSKKFSAFVDVLTYISQESMVQSNEDLLRLYNRYLTTGSRLAEDQLKEKGLINSELSKVKGVKQ